MVNLLCRQARNDSISPEALQVGSPSYLKDNPSYGQHYYIAALVPLVSEPPQELELAAPSPQLAPTHVGPTHGRASKHFACLPSTGPFEGLLLGSLVGRGSFGRVYRGLWKGQLVGVKVCMPLPPPPPPPSLPLGVPSLLSGNAVSLTSLSKLVSLGFACPVAHVLLSHLAGCVFSKQAQRQLTIDFV